MANNDQAAEIARLRRLLKTAEQALVGVQEGFAEAGMLPIPKIDDVLVDIRSGLITAAALQGALLSGAGDQP